MRSRREFMAWTLSGAAAAAFTGVGQAIARTRSGQEREKDKQVTANEDLMREHGVLRRALLVYFLTAPKLRGNPQAVAAPALHRTAALFRNFGENYHERALEEPYIFPAV